MTALRSPRQSLRTNVTRFCPLPRAFKMTGATGCAILLIAREASTMRDSWPLLEQIAFPPIRRRPLNTLQVNVGYRCNQSCVHCHVNAGPNRSEEMAGDVVDVVLAFLAGK